jgi:uncharacterized iron-regulated membrane protein
MKLGKPFAPTFLKIPTHLHRCNKVTGGGHWGDALSFWLRGLHMARDPLDYFAYRVFIGVMGLVVAMLSITGVYIWWKKRRARQLHRQARKIAMTGGVRENA